MQKHVNRPYTPEKLKKELYLEAGFRCAIPTCRQAGPLDIAHIHALNDGGPSDFNNLIVLCPSCHRKYDEGKTKFLDKEAMLQYKANLQIINGRYSAFELRLLEDFLDSEKTEVLLFGREIDIRYLLKDKLLEESSKRYANSSGLSSKLYFLTAAGRSFIEKWKKGEKI